MTSPTTDTFTQRAVAVFGTVGAGVPAWPYGLETPRRRPGNVSEERFQAAVRHAATAQHSIVEWAEKYGLRYSRTGCCQLWLLRTVSRKCPPGACRNHGGLDYVWLDHANGWLLDGRPAALTSATYSRGYDEDNVEIRQCLDSDSRLRAAFGTGWYGHGTTQVVLWRTDRIDEIAPA